MQKTLLIASLFLLVACTPKDAKFCECLQVSKDLNEQTNKALTSEITQELVDNIKSLREQKETKCEEYEMLGGQELLKKKAACGLEE